MRNQWLLKRAERNYSAVEAASANIDPLEWTLEQHKKLELFARYKTTAERAFSRFFNMLRGWRKDRFREEWRLENVHKIVKETADQLLLEKAEEEAAAQELEPEETEVQDQLQAAVPQERMDSFSRLVERYSPIKGQNNWRCRE